MNRNKQALKNERNLISSAVSPLDSMANTAPAVQKHTINFKGRKSSDIAGVVLSAITPSGGKVCDPFSGSCAFGIAAAQNGFNFFGSELDNYSFSVSKALFTKCNLQKLNEYFNKLKETCMPIIMDLYETQCCGKKNYIMKLHFDPEGENGFDDPEYYHPTVHRDITNNETIIMVAPCPICGNKRKIFENTDYDKIKYTKTLDTKRFPKHHLIENSRINITYTHDADKYDRNFTNRAQYALLTLQDAILTLPESPERDVLEQCLVASLTLARVCQYGSGSEYIYQVMRKQAQEMNIWCLFEDKFSSFVKYKRAYAELQSSDVTADDNIFTLQNSDYRDFLLKYDSYFDVIYTDPPYTDQVPYLERAQLYRDWLHAFYDKSDSFKLTDKMLSQEVVITNAPSRASSKSGTIQYYRDIDEMFAHFYNALKPDGRVVLTVKLGSNKYLLTLAEYIKFARKNGFEYITLKKVEKKDPTLRKQAAIKNTMMDEMLIFFTKLDEDSTYWYHGDTNLEVEITNHLYNKLKARLTETNTIMSLTECVSTTQQYLTHTYNILPNEAIQERIRRVIADNFAVTDDSLVYIDPNRIYLSAEKNTDLFAEFYDVIPVIIKNFDAEKGFTKEDLYFEIINAFFDGNENILDQIIETERHEAQINMLLDNYCVMDDDKRYYLKQYKSATNSEAQDVSSMDGYEFEDLIKSLLIKKGFYDVIRIGGAGDRGVDIMAKFKKDNVEEGYIIQCKRWIGNVGSTPIQRLHSMKTQMSQTIQHAICVTTSDYTSEGKAVAKNTDVEIINGIALMDELNQYFPGEYYHAALDII